MLQIKNLSLAYETPILQDINLHLQNGDICAIIGPSGCGKSSLLNILAGSIKTYIGEATLNAAPINHKKSTIGLISQDYGLLPWKTIHGNIKLPLKIKKLKVEEQKINYIMERLKILELKDRYPSQLSGGQRQRVAIAKTFILNLDLLLMDEPFSALDAITKEQTQELFFDIWHELKPLTIFVTHSIEEAIFLGKKIVLLSESPGRIIKIIENNTFGTLNPRESTEFLDLSNKIRGIIKKEWGKQ